MTHQEREEWFKNLKVGDKVAVACIQKNKVKDCQELTVKKVNKSGKIKLDNGSLWNQYQVCETEGGFNRFNYQLFPLEEKMISEYLIRERVAMNLAASNYWTIEECVEFLQMREKHNQELIERIKRGMKNG